MQYTVHEQDTDSVAINAINIKSEIWNNAAAFRFNDVL